MVVVDMENKESLMKAVHDLIRQEQNTQAQIAIFRSEGNAWGAEALEEELHKITQNVATTSLLFGIDEEEARRTFSS